MTEFDTSDVKQESETALVQKAPAELAKNEETAPAVVPQTININISLKIPNWRKGKILRRFLLLICLSVLVIGGIHTAHYIKENTAVGVARRYVTALLECDSKKADALRLYSDKTRITEDAEESGAELEEYLYTWYGCYEIEEYYEDTNLENKDTREEKYGAYSVTVRTGRKKVFAETEAAAAREDLQTTYGESEWFKPNRVGEICNVSCNVRIRGEKENETRSYYLVMVKYAGKWRVNTCFG